MKSHYAERFIENWMSHRSKAATCLVRLLRYNGHMSTISVQEIQRDFHGFLRRIEAGEVFVVVQGERPLAEVRPVAASATQPRPFGLCAGRFDVPADFDRSLPDDVLKEFEA